jgi:hypothetical protein
MQTLYTLEEVSERTGFALRTLQRDARIGKFAHVHRGRQRLMTDEQIELLLQQSTIKPAKPDLPTSGLDAVKKVLARSKS